MIVDDDLSREPGHPLGRLISAAAAGSYPPVDGGWHRVEPWRPGLEAVVAFTGHAVLALAPDIADEQLVAAGLDGFGGAHDPRLLAGLVGDSGWVDGLDVLLVGRGTGGPDTPPRLVSRPDLATHPRVQFAGAVRDDVRVLGHLDADRSAVAPGNAASLRSFLAAEFVPIGSLQLFVRRSH